MDAYIWFMLIVTVIGLIGFAILHKEEGVVQRIRVYGKEYQIRTIVYIAGKPVDGWFDVVESDDEFKRIKKNRKEQAQDFYDTLTFKKK